MDLKSKFVLLRKEKECLEKLISIIEEKDKIVLNVLKSKHNSLCFDYNCLNLKQFFLKVYMNTFYSKAGNSNSSFFLCELAEEIILARQYNIDFVAKFITVKGFGIKYGIPTLCISLAQINIMKHVIESSIKTSFSKRHTELK